MTSDFEIDFLSVVLEEVGRRQSVTDYEFTDEDIEGFRSRCGSDPTESSNVRRFFVDAGYEVCQNCSSRSDRCNCNDPDYERVYELSPEAIVEDWREDVASFDQYEEVFVEVEDSVWEVKAVSKEFGVLTFWIVTDSSQIVDLSPSIVSQEFVVSLVEAEAIAERDNHFMWYVLLEHSSHEELHSKIRDVSSPLSERICDLDSAATMDNINAIQTSIETYLTEHGYRNVDAQREVGGAGQVLDFSEVDFAAQNGDGVIVTCGCERSASDVHLHYIADEDVRPISESSVAETVAGEMRKRISKLETLRQNAYEMQGRTRAFLIAGAVVSIGPIIAAATGLLNLNADSLSGYPYYPKALVSVLLIGFLIILLLPALRMSLFSWDVRSLRTRAGDRIPYSNQISAVLARLPFLS